MIKIAIKIRWTIYKNSYIGSPYLRCTHTHTQTFIFYMHTGIEPFYNEMRMHNLQIFEMLTRATELAVLHLKQKNPRTTATTTENCAERLTYYFVNCIDNYFLLCFSCGGICATCTSRFDLCIYLYIYILFSELLLRRHRPVNVRSVFVCAELVNFSCFKWMTRTRAHIHGMPTNRDCGSRLLRARVLTKM